MRRVIMFFLCFLVGVSLGARASAQLQCQDLFDRSSQVRPADGTALVAISQLYDPFIVPVAGELMPMDGYMQVDEMRPLQQAQQRKFVRYQDMLTGLRFRAKSMAYQDDGLGAIYQNYGRRFEPQILADVQNIEKFLPLSRQSTVTIFANQNSDGQPQNLIGFFRVFDGSPYHKRGIIAHEKFHSDPRLPLEKIAALYGRRIKAVEKDREDRKAIFELGKYFISKSTTTAERQQLKTLLNRWIQEKILDAEEEEHTVFYVDVATEVHRRAYETEFGLKPILDPELNGGAIPPEYILRVDMRTLREHLNRK
jgi:hypothetical protein